MRISATEGKNRLGRLSAQARREPVFLEKTSRIDSVILSDERYLALKAKHPKPDRAARKKQFESEFPEWITATNARLEAHGIPGADLRPW